MCLSQSHWNINHYPIVTVSFSLSLSHRLNYHPIVIISSPLPLFHCHYRHLIVVVIISLSSHYKSRYTTSPTVSPTLSLLHRVCVCVRRLWVVRRVAVSWCGGRVLREAHLDFAGMVHDYKTKQYNSGQADKAFQCKWVRRFLQQEREERERTRC